VYLPQLSNISLASTTSLPVFALVYLPLIRAACTLHPASLVVQVLVVGSRSVGRCWGEGGYFVVGAFVSCNETSKCSKISSSLGGLAVVLTERKEKELG
jgi:hypothetical protein